MPKKISITFLFTMGFAIVALFAATHVLSKDKISPTETLDEYSFTFEESGETRTVFYKTNQSRTVQPSEVRINGQDFDNWEDNNKFIFCIQEDGGRTEFEGKRYTCHQLLRAKPESFLIGSSPGYCPFFWGGIWINLCP